MESIRDGWAPIASREAPRSSLCCCPMCRLGDTGKQKGPFSLSDPTAWQARP